MGSLIVYFDADAVSRRTFSHFCDKLGVQCTALSSIKEATSIKQSVDAVVVDESCLISPAFARWLRMVLKNPILPIIVCSSNLEHSFIEGCIASGATDHVSKPLDRRILTEKIMKFVRVQKQDAQVDVKPRGEGSVDATMDVELMVTEVSENGITLRSSHLMPNGTAIKLEGDVIEEISRGRPILVNVTSCEIEPGSKEYLVNCEFDLFDEALMQSIRVWLGLEISSSLPENNL